MFFIASKVFWLLVQPISFVLLLVVLGLALVLWGKRRSAIVALGLAIALQGVLGFTSLGFMMIQPLENRFAVPAEPPERVDAILMLGGATMARPSTARQISELNDAGDRLTTTLWLAGRYPEAKVVLSGGGGLFSDGLESEAVTVERFLLAHGIAADRIVLEDESRNTAENAAFSRGLVEGGEGVIVLVTSAFHMPRSVGLFRAQGVDVVAWPTDYRSSGIQNFGLDLSNPNQNLDTATVALREWIGLLAYYVTGRTAELLPAP